MRLVSVLFFLLFATNIKSVHAKKSICLGTFLRQFFRAYHETHPNERISNGRALEIVVAQILDPYVQVFRRPIYRPGTMSPLGDVDIETQNFIIEVKSGEPSKISLRHMEDRLHSPLFNPLGKQFIIFSQQPWCTGKRKRFERAGFIIITDINTLVRFIRANDIPLESLTTKAS